MEARIKEYFDMRLSGGDIAKKLTVEFGIEFTRNMVIGKRIRMGLVTDAKTARVNARRGARKAARRCMPPRESKKPPTNFTATSSKTGLFVSGVSLPKEPLPKEESPSDYAKLYSLDELTGSMCRWPVGDPRKEDFGFCGGEKVVGHSYCERHCRRAFRAPEPRIRKPAVERIPTYLDLEKV